MTKAAGGAGWRERLARVERAKLRALLAAALGIAAVAVTRWPAAGAIGAGVGWAGPGLVGVLVLGVSGSWPAPRRSPPGLRCCATPSPPAVCARRSWRPGGCPAPIAAEVAALAERSRVRAARRRARQFAHAVDDPVADHVVAALVVATERQASGLRDMLGWIAASAREQAGMRMRIEAGRARTYSQARFVVGFTPLFAIGVALMSPGYFSPFGTPPARSC